MKSALFVDFDNVYSGLRKQDPALADQFARQPMRWVQWLLNDLPAPEHAPDGAKRRLLVRRSYLNPQVYQRYRPAFNHAGFEIIDCPAMTSEGKTSTDIHMVLDMIELLQHEVHYDEFIVFSADADFTPVLRKLRRWDRRTTVLAIGFPAAAYRASADLVIDPEAFVREALSALDDELLPQPQGPSLAGWSGSPALLNLVREVHDRTGVPLIPPASFRALLEALRADLAVAPFQPSDTGQRVQDRCRAAGVDLALDDITWVLRGLTLSGHAFQQGQDDLGTLSYRLVGHLMHLCRREQMPLEEGQAAALQRWLSGTAAERASDGPD